MHKSKKRKLFFFILILTFSYANHLHGQDAVHAAWVDSVFKTLSLEEKIGQLIILRAHSDLGKDHIATVKSYIKKYHAGGVCFFQGTPEKQAELTAEYQTLSKVPLIVSM